jgi:hypothetical protein
LGDLTLESRRSIFKTSVVSAIGMMSGFSVLRASAQPVPATVIPVVGFATDKSKKKFWVIFVSRDVGKSWTVFLVPNQNFNKPSRPPYLDTENWFNAMTEKTDYVRLSGDFSIGGAKFTADGSGQLTAGQNYLSTPKWNEIGGARFCPTSNKHKTSHSVQKKS